MFKVRWWCCVPLLISVTGICQEAPRWGSAENPVRTAVPGMNAYYEPASIQKEGDIVRFRLYASQDGRRADATDEYSINCQTQEASQRPAKGNGPWSAPYRILPGESLFRLSAQPCDWEPGTLRKIYNAVN